MIKSSTYRGAVELRRDLLAAYSALDHRTTAELSPEQVDVAFRQLLARLSVLLYLHGATVPGQFLEAQRSTGKDDTDLVELAASFLESGRADGLGPTAFSELQQELVHFSRIVDIGTLRLDDSNASRAVRRLRGSRRLPDTLKVLSELIIVVRSRMLHRGLAVPVPWLRPSAPTGRELSEPATLWVPAEEDYLLLVASPRRRTRKEIAYLFSTLLSYLTPAEAVLAVWAHELSGKLPAWLDVALVVVAADRSTSVVSWSHPGGDITRSAGESIAWCRSQLPAVDTLQAPDSTKTVKWTTTHGVNVGVTQAGDGAAVKVTGIEQEAYSTVLVPPPTGRTVSVADMVARAHRLVRGYHGPQVLSIECGHIHLDRDLDIDQEVGVTLGAQVAATLAQHQTVAPAFTPMMDDDHVLVRLRPTDYRAFLDSHLNGAPMHLIAESSPIVRGIVCALWARLGHIGLASRCRERGQNLFLEFDGGTYCEIFEDVSGDTTTGCVFFEAALLVYRTAPARFDEYFRARFALTEDVHESACRILDGHDPHDDRIDLLQAFYAAFADVTDPRRPDSEMLALVDEVIESASAGVAHLNVLEDYYEVQQDKVRALIELLRLPMRLLSLHFNAQTGRVVLDA